MGKTFEPPVIDDVPRVLDGPYPWPEGPVEYRLFGHYKNFARGRTLILKTDGTVVGPIDNPVQMASQDNATFSVFVEQGMQEIPYTQIAQVFLGGHVYDVSQAVADLLIAAGFGSGISESHSFGQGGFGEGGYGG